MRLIRIGHDRSGNPVYFPESGTYNVVMILAKPRYGKSVLVRNVYTQIAENRNIIIIDYRGEHQESRYGNWKNSIKTSFIPDLYTFENFAFYISDFDNLQDLISMGFSYKSAPLVLELIKNEDIHLNNPILFLELLRELPSRDELIEKFNKKYGEKGLTFKSRVHDSLKHSIISAFSAIWSSGLLMCEMHSKAYYELTPGKIHVDDWSAQILKHKHVTINLNLVTSGSVPIARAAVGKILDSLAPSLAKTQPLIVVEEADFICPNSDDENITSLNQLKSYVLKYQRYGVELMFITQDPNLLSPYILMGGVIFIVGHHSENSICDSLLNEPNFNYIRDVVHQLRHDRYKGIREFAIIQSGDGGRYKIFQTDESLTRIDR